VRARGSLCTGMAWRSVYVCVPCMRVLEGRKNLGERRMEKEEKRHITQMRETDEASYASSAFLLRRRSHIF